MSVGVRAMGENTLGPPQLGASLKSLFNDHAAVLGRVAMALVGDAARAEAVLEQVARDARARTSGEGQLDLVVLLGLVRRACAVHLSRLPLRKHSTVPMEEAPRTERIGVAQDRSPARTDADAPQGEAIAARIALAALKPTEREALVLCFVGGLDAADIARACDVDLGTAKTRIARGIQELMKSESASEAISNARFEGGSGGRQ